MLVNVLEHDPIWPHVKASFYVSDIAQGSISRLMLMVTVAA